MLKFNSYICAALLAAIPPQSGFAADLERTSFAKGETVVTSHGNRGPFTAGRTSYHTRAKSRVSETAGAISVRFESYAQAVESQMAGMDPETGNLPLAVNGKRYEVRVENGSLEVTSPPGQTVVPHQDEIAIDQAIEHLFRSEFEGLMAGRTWTQGDAIGFEPWAAGWLLWSYRDRHSLDVTEVDVTFDKYEEFDGRRCLRFNVMLESKAGGRFPGLSIEGRPPGEYAVQDKMTLGGFMLIAEDDWIPVVITVEGDHVQTIRADEEVTLQVPEPFITPLYLSLDADTYAEVSSRVRNSVTLRRKP